MGMLWDTISLPSYKYPWKKLDGFKDRYSIQWVVSDQSRSNEPVQYVSLRSLGIIGAEMLCGRATIVLEVVSLEDYKNKNEKVCYHLF
jgi:hypothetical protein